MWLLKGDFSAADSEYQKAITLDDKDGGLWINRSMAQYRQGKNKQASESFNKGLNLSPELKQQYAAYSKLLNQ